MTDGSSRPAGRRSEWAAAPTDLVIEEAVPELLARRMATHHDRPAVWVPDGDDLTCVTWGALGAAAERVARALAGHGAPGDRVAVWSANSLPWIVLEHAVAMAGMVLVPFNPAWTDAEVTHAVQLVAPTFVFAGSARGQRLGPRARTLAPHVPVVDLDDLDRWAAAAPRGDLPTVRPDQAFLIQFTSGTTGRAKGATLSHRAAVNSGLRRDIDVIGTEDVYLNAVPYHHVGGSITVLLGALVEGGACVLLERWDPDLVLRILRHGVVTRLGGVPTMIIDLLDRLAAHPQPVDLASVSMGGTTVPEPLIHRVREVFGCPVVNIYSQSECPKFTSTLPDDDPAVAATTVGRPVAGASMRIVDPETGAVVPLGVTGEILVRSPHVMDGYWDMPDATAEVLGPDGWLRTGDLGSMDAHGYLTFAGRVRDVIIRGGENIYPAEVEAHLVEHPGVAAATLVGIDDPRLGEQVAGVVVRAPGSAVTGEELAAFLGDRVARFKIPVAWRFVDHLPMTASGKVRRFVVREETNAELRSSSAPTS